MLKKMISKFLRGGYKTSLKKRRLFIFLVFLMIAICVFHALPAGHYADFYPINGTFQNYNPVRRLLNGQVPYIDFADYLGMGHLYIGSIATVVFGGDYQGSLIAFSFLTFLAMGMLSYVIGNAVTQGEKEISLCITNLILLMLLVQPLFLVNGLAIITDIKDALNQALSPGTSARYIRGFIVPIVIGLFNFGCNIKCDHITIPLKLSEYKGSIGIGILAGFSFCWSNDYGISSWVCLAIMLVAVQFSRTRNFIYAIRHLIVEITVSLISLFIFIEFFTLGHFTEWFQFTFGTGGYQRWYYNSPKSYYLYDADFSFIMFLQAIIAVVYLWFLFKERGSFDAIKRYGVLAFVNITSFCAVNEYKILSGGSSREVALAILFLTVLFELINCYLKIGSDNVKKGFAIISITVGMAWIGSTLKDELVFSFATEKVGKYNESLGGYVTARSGDMDLASEFLNGERFWATYASGQEVAEGKFQPSGTDYIIHVLGDKQRDEYMNRFHEEEFRYVSTIQKDFTDWEYWVERANWFFYRELYRDWHVVFANQYQVYWEKNQGNKEYNITKGISLEAIREDEAKVRLIVRTGELIDGVADVFIDYKVKKKENAPLSMLMLQPILAVRNTGFISASSDNYESNFLRSESAEYIPIPVTNGYGEAVLIASPEKGACLELKAAECESIYTSMFDNLQTISITDNTWINGVHKNGNVLLLKYSESLLKRIERAESIGTSEQKFPIGEIDYDTEYIRVNVEGDANVCQYPSMLVLEDQLYER